jgi:hypothetical protein
MNIYHLVDGFSPDKLVQQFMRWDHQHYFSAGTNKTIPHLLFKDGITKWTDPQGSENVVCFSTTIVLLGVVEEKDLYWKVGDVIAKEVAQMAVCTMLHKLVLLWPHDQGQGW